MRDDPDLWLLHGIITVNRHWKSDNEALQKLAYTLFARTECRLQLLSPGGI